MTANRAASIGARLKRHADATKEEFNLILTHYGLERLLYRLSISKHAPDFILKGALLFQLWYGNEHRATRDADLLGFGSDDALTVVETFRGICTIPVDDGIVFDPDSIRGTEIRHDASNGGVRLHLRATLNSARIALQVDVGFGDAVTPHPRPIRYPTLLDDMPPPSLRVYPKTSVIAEKLHAVCVLGMTNSRMKDFFDLWILLRDPTIDDDELVRAIAATFSRRDTVLPADVPAGLSDAFAADAAKQTQWRAFLKKNDLEIHELGEVITFIRTRFLAVILKRK
jgi:hypothetical protein